METKLQQQLTGTAGVTWLFHKLLSPTWKKKPQGEEKVSIYMKESHVEGMPRAVPYPEASTCQTRLGFQSNSVHHLCSNRSILQEVDKEEEVEEPEHNQEAVTWGRSHSASGIWLMKSPISRADDDQRSLRQRWREDGGGRDSEEGLQEWLLWRKLPPKHTNKDFQEWKRRLTDRKASSNMCLDFVRALPSPVETH